MIYTKNNPKLIESIYYFENKETFSGVVKDQYGDIAYYLNGKFHRENGPATECATGGKRWCLNGKYHREDGPAIQYASGLRHWYLNGVYYGFNNDFTNESWTKFVKLQLLK